MFEVGELVMFLLDGARGIVVEVEARSEGGMYHIIWEDHFLSWEKGELLKRLGSGFS